MLLSKVPKVQPCITWNSDCLGVARLAQLRAFCVSIGGCSKKICRKSDCRTEKSRILLFHLSKWELLHSSIPRTSKKGSEKLPGITRVWCRKESLVLFCGGFKRIFRRTNLRDCAVSESE